MNKKERDQFRRSPTWRQFRADILNDRSFTCEICGIKKRHGLNIHHHDESKYDDLTPTKFSLLCPRCHQLLEQLLRRKIFDPITFGNNFRRIFNETKSNK